MKLRPLQIEGSDFIAGHLEQGRNAGLFDRMRVGKTPQAIRALDIIGATSALVMCPAHAKIKWQREFDQWCDIGRDVAVVSGTKTRIPDAEVLMVNYDIVHHKAVKEQLMQRRFDVLIGDEIQFLKNHRSKRAKAVLGPKSDKRNGLLSICGGFVPLSGTPKPNHPAELWPWLHAGMPEIIDHMDYWTFARRYCQVRETPFGVKIEGGRNLDELRDRLKTRFLRRTRKDAGIKEPSFSEIPLETKDIRALRELADHPDAQLLQDVIAAEGKLVTVRGDEEEFIGHEIQQSTLLRAIAMLKVAPLVDILRYELDTEMRKVLIFAIHTDAIKSLVNNLSEYGAVCIYGATTARAKQEAIDRFQNAPDCRVLVGQIQAAGSAITLDASDDIVFLEKSWVPGDNEQAAARCDAVGKEAQVHVRTCVLVGSADEKVQKSERMKITIDNQVFGE